MHEGRCLCGAVVFAVEGEPRDILVCHCTFCQRATGSGALVETIFAREQFALRSGTPKLYRHRSAGSGKMIDIHFCPNCGTKTHMTFERFPEIVGVFSGTFDEKGWFERDPENTLYFFLGEAPSGTVLPAGFDVYDAHYWASEGQPAQPQRFAHHTLVTEELRREARLRLQEGG